MKKGLTMVEVLIGMTILAIMMLTFSSIYSTGLKRLRSELAQTQMQTDAQILLDRMGTEIKGAKGAEQTFEGNTLSGTYLPLRVPAIDSNQNVIYNGGNIAYDHIIYSVEGKNLKRKVVAIQNSKRFGEAEKILSKEVSSFNFNYLPDVNTPEQVNISLTVEKKIGNETKTVNVKGGARFRNNL